MKTTILELNSIEHCIFDVISTELKTQDFFQSNFKQDHYEAENTVSTPSAKF